MSYKVVVDCVVAKDQAGKLQYVYEGGVIPWLSAEQAEHFLESNLVVDLGAAADDSQGDPADGDPADGGKPAPDATNKVLVAWLVDNALNAEGEEYTEASLKGHNKAELWELINAVADAPEEPSGDGSED